MNGFMILKKIGGNRPRDLRIEMRRHESLFATLRRLEWKPEGVKAYQSYNVALITMDHIDIEIFQALQLKIAFKRHLSQEDFVAV